MIEPLSTIVGLAAGVLLSSGTVLATRCRRVGLVTAAKAPTRQQVTLVPHAAPMTLPPRVVVSDEPRTPAEHAEKLVAWLRGPQGRTGVIATASLIEMYNEVIAIEVGWVPLSWGSVARALGEQPGVTRMIASAGGRRYRAYEISARPVALQRVEAA